LTLFFTLQFTRTTKNLRRVLLALMFYLNGVVRIIQVVGEIRNLTTGKKEIIVLILEQTIAV